MSERSSPKKSGSMPLGAVGLVFTIIFCVGLVKSPAALYSVFLVAGLGFAGLVISIVGIAKGSGRVAGVFGIFFFILGGLMTFARIMDIIAYERGLQQR
jgi:succinate-acetate transporter protein